MYKKTALILLLLSGTFVFAGVLDNFTQDSFDPHPRLFIDQAGIDRVKLRIDSGEEPYASQYQTLLIYANSAMNQTPDPSTSSDRNIWGDICSEQSRMARDLALAYKFTGKHQRMRIRLFSFSISGARPIQCRGLTLIRILMNLHMHWR